MDKQRYFLLHFTDGSSHQKISHVKILKKYINAVFVNKQDHKYIRINTFHLKFAEINVIVYYEILLFTLGAKLSS